MREQAGSSTVSDECMCRDGSDTMPAVLLIPGPRHLGDLLDRAFRLFRAHFWLLSTTAAAFLVPFSVLAFVITTSFAGVFDISMTREDASGNEVYSGVYSSSAVYNVVTALLYFLSVGLASLVLTQQSMALLQGRPASFGQSIRRISLCVWAKLIIVMVQQLATLVMAIAVLILITLLGSMSSYAFVDIVGEHGSDLTEVRLLIEQYSIIIVIAALVLLLVGYLVARCIAIVPSLIAEEIGPVQALRRSWWLTRHQARRSTGYSLLLGLIFALIGLMSGTMVNWVLSMVVDVEAFGWFHGISTGVGAASMILWLPVHVAAVVLLYYDLRVRREGYDLLLRVEQMEAQVRAHG